MTALQFPDLGLEGVPLWSREHAAGEALTPLVRVLVAGDEDGPGLRAMMALFQDEDAGGVPLDWPATDEEKTALGKAIERAIGEIARANRVALTARVARSLGLPADHARVAPLVDGLLQSGFAARQYLGRALSPTALQPAQSADPQTESGWTLDRAAAAVVYRAPSHAGRFLPALLDSLAVSASAAPGDRGGTEPESFRRQTRTAVFRDLTSDGGALYTPCMQCHTVARDAGAYIVRWRAQPAIKAALTSFNHAPHFTGINGETGCVSCHRGLAPEEKADGRRGSGFRAITKAQCDTCHKPAGAPETCVTCHTYHPRRASSFTP